MSTPKPAPAAPSLTAPRERSKQNSDEQQRRRAKFPLPHRAGLYPYLLRWTPWMRAERPAATVTPTLQIQGQPAFPPLLGLGERVGVRARLHQPDAMRPLTLLRAGSQQFRLRPSAPPIHARPH